MKYIYLLIRILTHPGALIKYLVGRDPTKFELVEIETWMTRKEINIIEAGSYDGRETVQFAKFWPTAKIMAYEPVPELYNNIVNTVAGYKNIQIQNKALSDHNGITKIISFSIDENSHGSSSILEPELQSTLNSKIDFKRVFEVECVTLEESYIKSKFDLVDVLWLDVQGMELRVLMASRDILKKIILCHIEISRVPLYKNSNSFNEINNFMINHNFSLIKVKAPINSGNAIYKNKSFI
jgi:FkbM family methyltransferase